MSSPTYRLRALARRASTEYVRLHHLALDLYKESATDPDVGTVVLKAQKALGEVAARLTARANVARSAWDCKCNAPDCAYCGPRLKRVGADEPPAFQCTCQGWRHDGHAPYCALASPPMPRVFVEPDGTVTPIEQWEGSAHLASCALAVSHGRNACDCNALNR